MLDNKYYLVEIKMRIEKKNRSYNDPEVLEAH